jgi:hypothetical protein
MMTYHITLRDEDYAALAAAAARTGAPIEEVLHEMIARQLPAVPSQQIGSYSHPSGERLTSEEQAELERLAEEMGSEKPWLSDMVIEDRGPR